MDSSIKQSLIEAHGPTFYRCIRKEGIKIKKHNNNCFNVSGEAAVKQCLNLQKRCKKESDLMLKRLQHSKPRKTSSKSEVRVVDERDMLLNGLAISIRLLSSESVFPTHKNTSTSCKLDENINSAALYQYILQNTCKDTIIVDYETSISFMSSALEELKKNHKKFCYTSVLKQLTSYVTQETDADICKFAVRREQLIKFFELIFSKVVPLKIFGKLRNLKKIKHALFHLLSLAHFQQFDLKPLVLKLDVSCIEWMSGINNANTKLLILLKLTNWLFVGFLFKVIYRHFQVINHTNMGRLFILKQEWNRIQRHFLQKKIRTDSLKLKNDCNPCYPPTGTFKLIPKFSDVRPILKPERSKEFDKQKTLMVNFLKQLHVTNFGVNNFENKWESIVEARRNTQTYMVYCDIVNAFGSIAQDLLFEIVKQLTKDLPEELMLKTYAVKSHRLKDSSTCYKQYFCHPKLRLPFLPGTIYMESQGSSTVKKSILLENISKCIFQQTVKIKEKTYTLRKGVAQGATLSPILSDLYYSFILKEQLAVFSQKGEILKYVDDILYVTKEEDSARQFLEMTKQGLPLYNCYFKQEKTRTNLTYDGRNAAENIIYIGYKIDCLSLESEPQYTKFTYPEDPKKISTSLQILESRLRNLTVLKLSKIFVKGKINRRSTVIAILDKSFSIQAQRARHLLLQLFGNHVRRNVETIFDIIRYTNELISRLVIRNIHGNEPEAVNETLILNRHIITSLWASYIDTFKTSKALRECLVKLFKREKRRAARISIMD